MNNIVEDTTSVLLDLKRRRNKKKRRNKSILAPKEERYQVEDEQPQRLVQPLTSFQPIAHDLVTLLDIYFPRPDTYSLYYLARVLGVSYSSTLLQQQIKIKEQDTIHEIPGKGYLPPSEPLDEIDPFYIKLLENPDQGSAPVHHATSSRLILSQQVVDTMLDEFAPSLKVQIGLEPNDQRSLTLRSGSKVILKITYQFEWYKVDENVAELILNVDKIHKENIETADFNTVLLFNIVLEHARSCKVWYARFQANEKWLVDLFGAEIRSDIAVFDLHNTSPKLSFLLMESKIPASRCEPSRRHRFLARLPNIEETQNAISNMPPKPMRKPTPFYSGSSNRTTLHLQATLKDDSVLLTNGQEPITVPVFHHEPKIEFFRDFVLPSEPEEEDSILELLKQKQKELLEYESDLQPRLTRIMDKIVVERLEYEKPENRAKRKHDLEIMEEHRLAVEAKKAKEEALRRRQEEDDNAVCAICDDGEVAPDNKIIFCESCDVAIHQLCYGVEKIPMGDYYCIACRYLGRDKKSDEDGIDTDKETPLPICCELCPIRRGAYVRTNMPDQDDEGKWVHAVCGKWQGLNFAKKNNPELLEDVTELKKHFLQYRIKCILCQGERGAMNQCRHEGCKNWVHVTCARATRMCEVVHGEDIHGPVDVNPWTVLCPEHSDIKSVPRDAMSLESLVELANRFPQEERPEPPPVMIKPFNQATGEERKLLRQIRNYDEQLLKELTVNRNIGLRCEVCNGQDDSISKMKKCRVCRSVHCSACRLAVDDEDATVYDCQACKFAKAMKKENKEFEEPCCVACYQPGGPLRPAVANPTKKSAWKDKQEAFDASLFGRPVWIHSICAFWCPKTRISFNSPEVNISDVVMAHGKSLIQANIPCILCGNIGGLKLKCQHPSSCKTDICGEKADSFMHVTCAKQAGLEVSQDEESGDDYSIKCYRHGGNEFNLRARIEDFLELEMQRAGKKLTRIDYPMPLNHASRLINLALNILQMLGWAWRWAEWWVDYDSSWEPLLEPGEKEEDMTKEQLKIVESTRESRCADARKCRLAAFGAALRNRAYDTEDGFDTKSLHNALTSLLNIPSLVGPLNETEIDVLREWLDMAYKSNARIGGLGDYKIPINADSGVGMLHHDGSPKFDLGSRSLPGSQSLSMDQVFEENISEVDDFMKSEVLDCPKREFKYKESDGSEADPPSARKRKVDDDDDPDEGSRQGRRGRKKARYADEAERSPTISKSGKRVGRPPGAKNKNSGEQSTAKKSVGRPRKVPKKLMDAASDLRSPKRQRRESVSSETSQSTRRSGRGSNSPHISPSLSTSRRGRAGRPSPPKRVQSPPHKKKRTPTPGQIAWYNRNKTNKTAAEEKTETSAAESPVVLDRNIRLVQQKREISGKPSPRRAL